MQLQLALLNTTVDISRSYLETVFRLAESNIEFLIWFGGHVKCHSHYAVWHG